ncbi:hypothetical protein [Kitasatospora sp. NPDC001132]
MITAAELAAIDAKAENRRVTVRMMTAGGFTMDAINHAIRSSEGSDCPDYCRTCHVIAAHADCLGCPDC